MKLLKVLIICSFLFAAGATLAASGGPDSYGYSWIDSDEADGPTYEWVDITSVGLPLYTYADDLNIGPLPIGFSFPFYGTDFTQFYACTNGWLSFTLNAGFACTVYGVPLPSISAPENLLAVWWDDLVHLQYPESESYYYNDGSRFIVEYFVREYASLGVTYRFQVILYPDGRIVYQYHTLDSDLHLFTIGIQNASKDDGLTVNHHDGSYPKENLAILFNPPGVGNTAPIAEDDDFTTAEDTPLSGEDVNDDNGHGADYDADGDPLTAHLDTDVSHGSLTLNSDGTFTYTPTSDYCGADSFTYHVNDGEDDSNVATVSITVTCVNDLPTVTVDPTSQTADYSDNIATVTITVSDVDDISTDLLASNEPTNSADGLLLTPDTPKCVVNTTPSPTEDGSTCTWTYDGQILDPGTNHWAILFTASDKGGPSASTAGTHTLSINPEDADPVWDDNPTDFQVVNEGTSNVDFSLTFFATEYDATGDGDPENPGDLNNARGFIDLYPVGPGPMETQPCELPVVVPDDGTYDQVATFECIFTSLDPNVYEIIARVDGESSTTAYYFGESVEDVLVVSDPSLGFTTGGGFFYWPDTQQAACLTIHAYGTPCPLPNPCYPHVGDKTNFGFSFKYNKKQKNVQGSLLMMRHTVEVVGDLCVYSNYKVKSNAIDGMGLGTQTDSGGNYGWAAVTGKATFRDPSEENTGGNAFLLYMEDHGDQGCSQDPEDEFWIEVDALNVWLDPLGPNPALDEPSETDAPDAGDDVPIFCGNIVVPYDDGKLGHGKGKPEK